MKFFKGISKRIKFLKKELYIKKNTREVKELMKSLEGKTIIARCFLCDDTGFRVTLNDLLYCNVTYNYHDSTVGANFSIYENRHECNLKNEFRWSRYIRDQYVSLVANCNNGKITNPVWKTTPV